MATDPYAKYLDPKPADPYAKYLDPKPAKPAKPAKTALAAAGEDPYAKYLNPKGPKPLQPGESYKVPPPTSYIHTQQIKGAEERAATAAQASKSEAYRAATFEDVVPTAPVAMPTPYYDRIGAEGSMVPEFDDAGKPTGKLTRKPQKTLDYHDQIERMVRNDLFGKGEARTRAINERQKQAEFLERQRAEAQQRGLKPTKLEVHGVSGKVVPEKTDFEKYGMIGGVVAATAASLGALPLAEFATEAGGSGSLDPHDTGWLGPLVDIPGTLGEMAGRAPELAGRAADWLGDRTASRVDFEDAYRGIPKPEERQRSAGRKNWDVDKFMENTFDELMGLPGLVVDLPRATGQLVSHWGGPKPLDQKIREAEPIASVMADALLSRIAELGNAITYGGTKALGAVGTAAIGQGITPSGNLQYNEHGLLGQALDIGLGMGVPRNMLQRHAQKAVELATQQARGLSGTQGAQRAERLAGEAPPRIDLNPHPQRSLDVVAPSGAIPLMEGVRRPQTRGDMGLARAAMTSRREAIAETATIRAETAEHAARIQEMAAPVTDALAHARQVRDAFNFRHGDGRRGDPSRMPPRLADPRAQAVLDSVAMEADRIMMAAQRANPRVNMAAGRLRETVNILRRDAARALHAAPRIRAAGRREALHARDTGHAVWNNIMAGVRWRVDKMPNRALPAKALATVERAMAYDKAARMWAETGKWINPAIAPFHVASKAFQWITDVQRGNPSHFLGMPKGGIRWATISRDERVPEFWQAAMREAQGSTTAYAYRVADLMREKLFEAGVGQSKTWAQRLGIANVDDLNIARDMLKFEHEQIIRDFVRNDGGRAGTRYSLAEGIQMTPTRQRQLDVGNRWADFNQHLKAITTKGTRADAFFNNRTLRDVYYPETYEIVDLAATGVIDALKRKYHRLSADPDDIGAAIAAGAQAVEHGITGRALMANIHRRGLKNPKTGAWIVKPQSVAQREAGVALPDGQVMRLKGSVTDDLLGSLPEAYGDFAKALAYKNLASNKDGFLRIATKESLIARRTGAGKQAMTAAQIEGQLKAQAVLKAARKAEGWVEIGPHVRAQKWTVSKGLRDAFGWTKPFNTLDAIPNPMFSVGNMKKGMSSAKVGPYGELSGMLHPDIAWDMIMAGELSKQYHSLGGIMTQFFKASKTILAPATHATNFLSNLLVLAPIAGVGILNPNNWKYYARAAKAFAKGANDPLYRKWVIHGGKGPGSGINRSELIQQAERGTGLLYRGLTGKMQHAINQGGLGMSEVAKFMKAGQHGDFRALGSSGREIWKVMTTIPGAVYQSGDDFYRLIKTIRDVDASITTGLRGDRALLRASDDVWNSATTAGRKAFADYENLAGAFQIARSAWWGQPFLAFDARVLPMLADKLAVSNQFKAHTYIGIGDMITSKNMQEAGLDEEAIAGLKLPWYEDHMFTWLANHLPELVTEDANGEFPLARINTGKYIPGGRRIPLPGESTMQWFGRAFSADNPVLSTVISETANWDMNFKRSIYNTGASGEGFGSDSLELQNEKIQQRRRMTWLPPYMPWPKEWGKEIPIPYFGQATGYGDDRMAAAELGRVPYGRDTPRPPWQVRLQKYAGIDIKSRPPKQAIKRQNMILKSESDALFKQRFRLEGQKRSKSITPESYRREMLHWNQELLRFKAMKEKAGEANQYLTGMQEGE